MKSQDKIQVQDKIIEKVRKDLLDRSRVGIEKYKITLDKENLPLKDWLVHAYHETLDNANYLKKAITLIEEQEENEKKV